MKYFLLVTAVIFTLFEVSAKDQPALDAELVKLIEENKQTELQDFLKKKSSQSVRKILPYDWLWKKIA